MTLWFVFALMTVAAIFAVLLPLGRNGRAQNQGSEVAVYKDQLAEIERDLAVGLIAAPEAEAARVEVSRRLLAAPVQGLEVISPRFDGVRNPDPQRTGRQRRRNGGDRFGQRFAAGLVDQHDLRPDHKISVGGRNDVVFKFNKIND